MPAHSSGAAASKSSDSGTRSDEVLVDDDVGRVAALGDGAVAVDAAVGLGVAVEAVLLLAGRQFSHSRQELTMQPTPTRSPTACLVTSEPTSVTVPTISWPTTCG